MKGTKASLYYVQFLVSCIFFNKCFYFFHIVQLDTFGQTSYIILSFKIIVSSFASSHNQKKDNNKFKTKNNQNCQKTELYGSLTTKELKKTGSSRPVEGMETGSGADRTQGKVVAGGPSEAADYGTGWARLQLSSKAAAGRPGETVAGGAGGPTFVCR